MRTMLVDGKQIAEEWKARLIKILEHFPIPPTLAIVIVGANPVVESFVRIKKKFGLALGVAILEFRFDAHITQEDLEREVGLLALRKDINGLIIQLPLPPSLDVDRILNTVPVTKDVDVLSHEALVAFARGTAQVLPPVALAVQDILERARIDVAHKEVLILGHGRLVGKPVALLMRHNAAHVTVIDQAVPDLAAHVRDADIVIAGVGKPNLVKPEMVKPGMVFIDAGTSESHGKIVGDIDAACGKDALLTTPVPGGVGPVAVAMLFKNLLILARAQFSGE